jgi:3-methyladenine DNA glycosylase AlkD
MSMKVRTCGASPLLVYASAANADTLPHQTRGEKRAMTMSELDEIRETLQAHAQAARAAPMRADMRNQVVFLGIPTPLRRQSLHRNFKDLKGCGAAHLIALAKQLWSEPEREYQYAALDMLALRHKELNVGNIADLLLLAQDKSWWDTVDALASIIGDILAGRHDGMDDALTSPNMWLRRIAMLHQLGWRGQTDRERLFHYACTLAPEREFFIQKAIGWALRDYAHHDPDAVLAFLQTQKHHLAPLTCREASKHLGKTGAAAKVV